MVDCSAVQSRRFSRLPEWQHFDPNNVKLWNFPVAKVRGYLKGSGLASNEWSWATDVVVWECSGSNADKSCPCTLFFHVVHDCGQLFAARALIPWQASPCSTGLRALPVIPVTIHNKALCTRHLCRCLDNSAFRGAQAWTV